MARIRTLKPEFFTSEDIVSLSPLTRLLYIAIWCEADREGRFVWKPITFKLRYFPGDDCDILGMCDALVTRGLLVRYASADVEYAYIPTFHSHQHINPREAESQLPEPCENKRVSGSRKARVNDASTTRNGRDPDAQVGREGKGKERKEKERVGLTQELRAKDEADPTPPPAPDALSPLTRDSSSASQGKSRNGTGTGTAAGMKRIGMDVRELLAEDIPKVEASPDDELETQRRRAEQLRKLREGAA